MSLGFLAFGSFSAFWLTRWACFCVETMGHLLVLILMNQFRFSKKKVPRQQYLAPSWNTENHEEKLALSIVIPPAVVLHYSYCVLS